MVAKKAPPNKKTFTKEMAAIILELGKEGASQKAMYAAIGISKDTAARWKDEDEFFKETMSLATTHGQAFWENMMLANIDNRATRPSSPSSTAASRMEATARRYARTPSAR